MLCKNLDILFYLTLIITCIFNVNSEELINIPPADNATLRIISLPMGQGESTIIQCPTGELIIIDMGSSDGSGWGVEDIKNFLKDDIYNVHQLIVSHASEEHYNLIPLVFPQAEYHVKRIIVGGNLISYSNDSFVTWLLRHAGITHYVNNNKPCISDCYDNPPNCPNDPNVEFKYLGANLGKFNNGSSLILQLKAPDFKMIFPGDFVGHDIESLVIKEWEYSNQPLKSTHLKLSRHGESLHANSLQFLQAVSPQYVVVSSSYPSVRNMMPECETISNLLKYSNIKKRDSIGEFVCANRLNNEIIQFSSWPYQIYSTAPVYSNFLSLILISISVHNGTGYTEHLDKLDIMSEMRLPRTN